MSYKKLKLISVRLDPDVIRLLDEEAKKKWGYTRSSLINSLLVNLLKCSTGGTIWKMISTCYPYENGYVVKFEKDAEVLKKRNKPNYDD